MTARLPAADAAHPKGWPRSGCSQPGANDPKPGKNGKQADAPCFQRVISLFSLCYLLLEKLSKFLIPLSDCPFVLNCLPVFLGKSPCFREKTGKVIYRRHPQYDSHAAAAAFSRETSPT